MAKHPLEPGHRRMSPPSARSAHASGSAQGDRPEPPGSRPGEEVGLCAPSDWQVVEADTFGRFYTRIVYLLPDGDRRVWTSRRSRLGLALARPTRLLVDAEHKVGPGPAAWLPWRLSWWISIGYLVGSAVFLVTLVLQLGPVISSSTGYWCYLGAAAVFAAANYLGLVSALNDTDALSGGPRTLRGYRWWGFRSDRIGYLISLSLFTGSLLFLLRSVGQVCLASHWPWVSDAGAVLVGIGSVIFLVATGVEVREARIRTVWWEPRNLAWWRASLSFLGCVGFVLGAGVLLVSTVLPNGVGSISSDLAFLIGTGLFLMGGYLILPELAQQPELDQGPDQEPVPAGRTRPNS